MGKDLPAKVVYDSQKSQTNHAVWIRISAFLALKSSNTQRTYASVVSEWCHFLGAEPGSSPAAKKLLQATDLDAVRYKIFLESRPGQKPRLTETSRSERSLSVNKSRRKGRSDGLQSTLANATLNKKFAALRRIYRMLIASNLGINQNPFDTDKVPPPPSRSGLKRPTEMIPYEKVLEVMSLPDIKTLKGLRDQVVLAILFGGGLRRSEAVSLRIGDVRKTNKGTVYLTLRSTKAKKDAEQALPSWAARPLLKLVEARLKQGARDGDYLLVSFRGRAGNTPTEEPLSDSGLYKLFKSYCLRAGAGDYATPHSARATAITKLLDSGKTHREVQEFSRHASVQMVEVYDKRRVGVDENPATTLEYEK